MTATDHAKASRWEEPPDRRSNPRSRKRPSASRCRPPATPRARRPPSNFNKPAARPAKPGGGGPHRGPRAGRRPSRPLIATAKRQVAAHDPMVMYASVGVLFFAMVNLVLQALTYFTT